MYTIGTVLLISIVVGGIIGALTNLIAITMLFRPHYPIKLWGWRLPFTPGIIPKRHQEIAHQLGQVVEKHLVTKEALQEYLGSSMIQQELKAWIEHSLQTIVERVKQTKVGDWSDKLGVEMEELAHKGVQEFLGRAYGLVHSREGERLIYQFIETAVERQGSFRRMIDMLLPKEKVTSKLQEIIGAGLQKELTHTALYQYLYQELRKLEEKRIDELIQQEQEQKLAEYLAELADQLLSTINTEILQLVTKLRLAEIVEKQILAYPLPQLEKMILEVVSRELKMITLFGGLLGGGLGGIQVVIFLLFKLI